MKSIFEKRYITEAQATKAIEKEFGDDWVNYIAKQDGRQWIVIEIPKVAPSARQEQEAAITEFQAEVASCKNLEETSLMADRLNQIAKTFKLTEAVVAGLDELLSARVIQIEGEAALTQAQVAGVSELKNGKPWVKASTALKPTKLVWAIADAMYEEAERRGEELGQAPVYPSRKEVQEVCVSQGIASGTARTQFQHWFKQRNESAATPRATIGEDGKIIPAKA